MLDLYFDDCGDLGPLTRDRSIVLTHGVVDDLELGDTEVTSVEETTARSRTQCRVSRCDDGELCRFFD
jgi:hypothetical protein